MAKKRWIWQCNQAHALVFSWEVPRAGYVTQAGPPMRASATAQWNQLVWASGLSHERMKYFLLVKGAFNNRSTTPATGLYQLPISSQISAHTVTCLWCWSKRAKWVWASAYCDIWEVWHSFDSVQPGVWYDEWGFIALCLNLRIYYSAYKQTWKIFSHFLFQKNIWPCSLFSFITE